MIFSNKVLAELRDLSELNNPDAPEGWIYIGDDELRYAIGKPGERNLIVIGVNPGTAVPNFLDRTLERVVKMASDHGYDGWLMLNLCSKRFLSPDRLPISISEADEIYNIRLIEAVSRLVETSDVLAVWGDCIENRSYLIQSMAELNRIFAKHSWYTAGELTENGHPEHPLNISKEPEFYRFDIDNYIKAITHGGSGLEN